MFKKILSFFKKGLTASQNDATVSTMSSTKGANDMNKVLNAIIENGKICKVEFIKKDGSVGVVHGRTGVHKHARGGKRTSSDDQYIMFYDFDKGYRNVNRRSITKVNGINLKITTR
jgi:hypothetical protein